jgi:hypothetical protein
VADKPNEQDLEQKGWGVTSVGQDPITFYALVQCLEDLNNVDCTLCYSENKVSSTKMLS